MEKTVQRRILFVSLLERAHRSSGQWFREINTGSLCQMIEFANPLHKNVVGDRDQFLEMPLDCLGSFEKCFQVNGNLYQLENKGVTLT